MALLTPEQVAEEILQAVLKDQRDLTLAPNQDIAKALQIMQDNPDKAEMLMEDIRDELTSRGAAAMHADADVETRVRAAVEAFFDYVEERPAAARVLLVTPRGEPELTEASALVQAQATAALTDLLVAEAALLPGARNRRRRIELITEFLKQGLHGLAEWWAEHPDTPKRALVDAALDVAWSGLRSGLVA